MAEAYVALEAESRKPGKDFGELVRQRRKERGLLVPICDRVLPLRVVSAQTPPVAPDAAGQRASESADSDDQVDLRANSTELRVHHALRVLVEAELRGPRAVISTRSKQPICLNSACANVREQPGTRVVRHPRRRCT